ncbi:MAG: NAD(P)H-dependent oxidoreductase [Legionella sp.]|uniref:NADPH-dependent FMN reductase n=1 Tax=Legionella sp. TaxID=459 RepID=UPI002850C6FF|nr:NAD(P)H-dependent oxidoreductase [Legionella sp.]
MSKKIAVIVGSLRKESYNRKMAHALMAVAPQLLSLKIIEIDNLPLYNQDLDDENRPAEAWLHFRDQIKMSDGVLFVTPEYNRSVPGALKNAIDVGSRPYGKSVWSKKPGAVISVSPGAIGGFGANHHLRQSFVFLDIPVLQQPEAYIGGAANLFNAQGELANEDTKKFIQQFMNAYAQWVELNTNSK